MITEKNVEKVLSSYKPPIFWKDKDFIKKTITKLVLRSNKFTIERY